MTSLRVLVTASLLLAGAAVGQTVDPPPTPQPPQVRQPTAPDSGPQYILGSGAGFKPYQTSIQAGSSAFVEGGMKILPGVFAFARVDLRSTDAQMIVEGCKTLPHLAQPYLAALVCGGPGFGVDASNIGVSFAGGGKLFFSPGKQMQRANAWLAIEMGVAKTTVPAPVSPQLTTVSPVQPDFRIGIFKTF